MTRKRRAWNRCVDRKNFLNHLDCRNASGGPSTLNLPLNRILNRSVATLTRVKFENSTESPSFESPCDSWEQTIESPPELRQTASQPSYW